MCFFDDIKCHISDGLGFKKLTIPGRVLVNSRKPVIFSGCEAQSCRLLVLEKKKKKKKKRH